MKNRNLEHKDDWATPDYILKPLRDEFGDMFDPCPLNHDLNSWDGLTIDWKQTNFINPPYSRELKEAFIKKAFEESKKGKICVMLLPVSTSTKIFHIYIYTLMRRSVLLKEGSSLKVSIQKEKKYLLNVGCMILW